MRVDEKCVIFARSGSVGDANDHVREAGICFIEPFAHHVESKRALDAQFNDRVLTTKTHLCEPLPC
jgi:hypothetical protein